MTLLDLQTRLKSANALLSPHAIPHQGILGRPQKEPEDDTRFPFQRDRDRIIHTQAFRRLQGKTQVFVAGEGDHFRTRLTHTMEVAQIARDIARTLRLNEDLTECIALAHDLGHPPFGHMGEYALRDWMEKHESTFEHNEQSLRFVMLLEEHSPLFPGLNLNREVLEGMQKHRQDTKLSLEAQIVNLADEIAYSAHDCDDGLQAGLFAMVDLQKVSLVSEAIKKASARQTSLRGSIIHLLVHDLYTQANGSKTSIDFSAEMRHALNDLRVFLQKNMYDHRRVLSMSKEGQKIILDLCDTHFKNPPQKILQLQKRTKSTLPEAIKDYVAGMTDAYARSQRDLLYS